MMHYVCTGDCGGESHQAKVCDAEGCSKEGQPLLECSCEDGLHKGVVATTDEPDLEKMDDEDDL